MVFNKSLLVGFKIILLSIIMLQFYSCEKDGLQGDIVIDNELRNLLYIDSKDTLNIDMQNLVLETELYRDFFPGGGIPEKRGLTASLNVRNIDSLLIEDNVDIVTLYVINGEQIWISTPESNDNYSIPDFILHRVSNDGPEWDTGNYVDVVVEIRGFSSSAYNYLISRDQLINRIE